MVGHWTRFWAPGGQVAGERYLLLADGRFGRLPAPEAAEADAPGTADHAARGRWQLSGARLVLSAQGAPVREIQLGQCPDNAEARALDPHYACASFDGEAYFRHAVAPGLAAEFLPQD